MTGYHTSECTKFNEGCVAFDIDLQDLENNIPQSAWEMVAPNISQDHRTTNAQGFYNYKIRNKEKNIQQIH